MKRVVRGLALVTALGLGAGLCASPAGADESGSAFAGSVQVAPGTGVTATTTTGGAAAFAAPRLQAEADQVINDTTAWARQLPSRLALLAGGSDGTAVTPITSQSPPGDVDAVSCDTWAAGACFTQDAGSDDLSGELLVLPTPTAAGWTARDDSVAAARVTTSGTLQVLGQSLVSLDTSTTAGSCDAATCTVSALANGQMGVGYGRFAVDPTNGLTVDIGEGGAYVPVSAVSDGVFSLGDGRQVTISHHGSALTFDVDLTVEELFRATGSDQTLSDDDKSTIDPSSTVQLTVSLSAPGATGTANGSIAALELSVGLHADLVFSVGGGLTTVTADLTADLATLDLGRVAVTPEAPTTSDDAPTRNT